MKNEPEMIEYADGSRHWYDKNGNLHRVDGPALELSNGAVEWLIHGTRHREDGPAIEHLNGAKEWWLNGLRHREDGPAIERADGRKQWWINDYQYYFDEFAKIMKWSTEQIIEWKLTHEE